MAYEINEELARRAHEMRSTRDYKPDSATAEYLRQVEEARRIAEESKARCKNTAQRNRVDGIPCDKEKAASSRDGCEPGQF